MNDRTTEPLTELEPPTGPEPSTEPTQSAQSAQPSGVAAPAPRDRRVLRAVARWAAAAAVFAAVGTATAYGIAGLERTDVPGLATESDGRWDYPELTSPPLPSGSPGPFAAGNAAGTHHADLRALVLPAPAGAREDKALRGPDGWLATKEYLAEYAHEEDREALRQQLVDTGLRHIAARGWTTPDGTRTRIYLLQFDTAQVVEAEIASQAVAFTTPVYSLRGSHDEVYDEEFPEQAAVSGVVRTAYAEPKPYGAEQVRQAHLSAGDVYAVILQSRKGGVGAVPFRQTVVLQGQLLG
ncbi:hypothetical protein [Streptomyces sp. Tu 3180]|uniref:hypothetical protein n=1 Tax=Streptomyces sp. Tu 3180 TaxID=2682611 RepID=UPI00135A2536|nr:hypothetical protein [Streptomyces sp. Tu 3180]KAF3466165.1 hypothetical protein GL259_18720 [Streptomyces sp. Tu 3180]